MVWMIAHFNVSLTPRPVLILGVGRGWGEGGGFGEYFNFRSHERKMSIILNNREARSLFHLTPGGIECGL